MAERSSSSGGIGLAGAVSLVWAIETMHRGRAAERSHAARERLGRTTRAVDNDGSTEE